MEACELVSGCLKGEACTSFSLWDIKMVERGGWLDFTIALPTSKQEIFNILNCMSMIFNT